MNLFRTVFAAILAVGLSIVPALAHSYKLGDLDIGHPFSKAMFVGAKVAGGYLKITNNGPVDDRLVRVSASIGRVAQLHEMKMENDVMLMRELPGGIEIPAGETVELAPGGLHIMFLDVATPTKEGDKFKAVLTF